MQSAAIILLAVLLFGCGDTPPGDSAARPPAAGAAVAPPTEGVPPAGPDSLTIAPESPGATDTAGTGAPGAEWTVGRLEGPPGTGSAVLQAVRAGRQVGYDRVVFEFADGPLPGYRAEYVDSPQHQCGSGDEIRLPGEAWIQVDLEPAQAHDDEGRPTVVERTQRPGLPNLLELRAICDFEGQVTWILGLRSPEPFRILRLEQPTRLVVDVSH